MAHTLRNSNSRIALELSRTAKHARCIMTLDSGIRDIRNQPLVYGELIGFGPNKRTIVIEFDKEWKPLTNSPAEVALRWLEADNLKQIPLSERARKELIMLVLFSQDNTFIAKFADNQENAALESAPAGAGLAKNAEELTHLSAKDLVTLYVSLGGEEAPGRTLAKKSKTKIAEAIWEMAEALQLEPKAEEKPEKPAPVAKAADPNKPAPLKHRIRTLLTAEGYEAKTAAELAALAGDTEAKVKVALYDLTKPQFAGKGGVLDIEKSAEGRYSVKK